jgi:glycosyltransferase A (GT-A) superfamily protein (DUF2064 family)
VDATLLIVAKAPVPGFAKTRLVPPLSPAEAAGLAAAALLDTLAAAAQTPVRHRVVALTGDLAAAQCRDAIGRALGSFDVVAQRGVTFAERLAAAHADAAAMYGLPVLQVGMDTPQLTPGLLGNCAAALTGPEVDAVLGPAADGGWWALGLRAGVSADWLREVPMSTDRTGAATLARLRRFGLRTRLLPELVDVDYPDDAIRVAALGGAGRFVPAVGLLAHRLSAGPSGAER